MRKGEEGRGEYIRVVERRLGNFTRTAEAKISRSHYRFLAVNK